MNRSALAPAGAKLAQNWRGLSASVSPELVGLELLFRRGLDSSLPMPLHMFRVSIESETTIRTAFTGPLRADAPTTLGAIGTETGTGEQVWLLAFEWPEWYAPVTDKAAKERQHLNRFSEDVRVGTGEAPYETTAPGPDPRTSDARPNPATRSVWR